MLRNTFIHLPGVGSRMERRLWAEGITTWEALFSVIPSRFSFSPEKRETIGRIIHQSILHLESSNPQFFGDLIPSGELWRIFPDFRDSLAYLDIETTGVGGFDDTITTISLYDGQTTFTFVCGDNMEEFRDCVENYGVIVTYNGKCFDIPLIRRNLGIPMNQVHIDLRYLLKSLGLGGGLKRCEKMLGIKRHDLEGMDGFHAVLLWDDYQRNGNAKSLEKLLAYNTTDTVNLETLMVHAYNYKIQDTPFRASHRLETPPSMRRSGSNSTSSH